MELTGRAVVVTGGASGIGRALCRRFAAEGARAVVVVDIDGEGARAVAEEIATGTSQAMGLNADMTRETDVTSAVERATGTYGPIDLFCSNAGVARGGGAEAPDEAWDTSWRVNVMAHVLAARAVLPQMLQRGEGYLLHTASAAGLLTNLGAAPYTVTKHAVVALAEWLAITHGDAGIKVSCLCPQGVRTPMLLGDSPDRGPATTEGAASTTGGSAVLAAGGLIEPEDVADAVITGLGDERFLILPQPEVAKYVRRRAEDRDRWLSGMRRVQARLSTAGGERLRLE